MTDQDMKEISGCLINTPCKCLGRKTPAEMFREKMMEEKQWPPYPYVNKSRSHWPGLRYIRFPPSSVMLTHHQVGHFYFAERQIFYLVAILNHRCHRLQFILHIARPHSYFFGWDTGYDCPWRHVFGYNCAGCNNGPLAYCNSRQNDHTPTKPCI